MNRSLIAFLLLCGLPSCSKNEDLTVKSGRAPGKSTKGADIVVCMVNGDPNLQVYREVPKMLFDEDEIHASHYITKSPYTPGHDSTVYLISAERRPGEDPALETDIRFEFYADNPVINTPYRLYSINGGGYSTGGGMNEYFIDTATSGIIFSRFDIVVAAGEFALTAINRQNDTVYISGYFDVLFDR